jgi:hypothetical protein
MNLRILLFILFTGLLRSQATPPSLVADASAPQGMTIVRDAIKIRLKNPYIRYEMYTFKAFVGIGDPSKNMVGWVLRAKEITPAGNSFKDGFGTVWYDVTPGSATNELIVDGAMSALLNQPGTPPDQFVSQGRWAITKLTDSTAQPLSVAGREVSYSFSVMCYTPIGASGETLVLGKRDFTLSFPIQGVPQTAITPAGNIDTQTFISPYEFSQSVTSTQDVLTTTPVMTSIRPWIWPRAATFDLGGWSLDPATGLSGPLSIRDAWNRSFQNVTDFVIETSTGSRPHGHRLTNFPDTLQAGAPFFISGGRIINNTVVNILQMAAAQAAQPVQWPFSEEIILHSAPSSGSGSTGSDTTIPTVAITSPASDGTTVTTSSLTISGIANDNIGVASVSLRINGGSWITAEDYGTDTWSHTVTLNMGSNIIEARAQDAAGNISPVTSRQVTLAGISTPTGLRLQ